LGSTLDPLALALAVWAVVLFVGTPPLRPRGWLAGVLLGIATFINPLALLVLVALTLAGPNPARGLKSRNPRMMLAAATITSALLLVVDLTAIDRIIHWYSDAVDGGSFASILVMAELGGVGGGGRLWGIVRAAVSLAVAVSLYMARASGLFSVVSDCLLLVGCLLLAPGIML